MENPKISVVTIVKNDPEGFLITARSILNQTYPNIEWIVVDGLSTDDTRIYLRKLKPRFAKLISEQDSGIYNAMNKAIDLVSGEWTFFMNADDVFFCEHTISDYVNRIQPNDDILYSDVMRREDRRIHFYRPVSHMWLGMIFDHQTVLARSDIYKILRYDESYKIAGDYDLFSRARVKGYNIRKLPWVIGCRKPFSTGASSSYVDRQIERIRVIKEYFNSKPWKSILAKEYEQTAENKIINQEELSSLIKLLED